MIRNCQIVFIAFIQHGIQFFLCVLISNGPETLQRKITFYPYLVSGSVHLPRVFSWTLDCRSSLLIFYQQQEKYFDRNVLV